jgi:hypothetical protein
VTRPPALGPDAVAAVRTKAASGASISAIARDLKVPRSTVRLVLRRGGINGPSGGGINPSGKPDGTNPETFRGKALRPARPAPSSDRRVVRTVETPEIPDGALRSPPSLFEVQLRLAGLSLDVGLLEDDLAEIRERVEVLESRPVQHPKTRAPPRRRSR